MSIAAKVGCPMARTVHWSELTVKQFKMLNFLKVYCTWDECSLLHYLVADSAVFRRSLVGSKWWVGMSLAGLTVRITENVPLWVRLGW